MWRQTTEKRHTGKRPPNAKFYMYKCQCQWPFTHPQSLSNITYLITLHRKMRIFFKVWLKKIELIRRHGGCIRCYSLQGIFWEKAVLCIVHRQSKLKYKPKQPTILTEYYLHAASITVQHFSICSLRLQWQNANKPPWKAGLEHILEDSCLISLWTQEIHWSISFKSWLMASPSKQVPRKLGEAISKSTWHKQFACYGFLTLNLRQIYPDLQVTNFYRN